MNSYFSRTTLSSRRRWYLAPFLFLLSVTAGCSGHAESREHGEASGAMTSVSTVAPVYRDLTHRIVQPGYLRPYEQTPVYAKISGYVEAVNVDLGDKVKKDQVLAKLSVPEVVEDLNVREARVQQADADLIQAGETVRAARATRESSRAKIQETEAGIAKAESDVQRWQAESDRGSKLIGRGVYDQQTLDEMQNQLRSSQAALNEAKAKRSSALASFDESSARLSKAEADVLVARARLGVTKAEYAQWKAWLAYSELRAPFDGVVTLRNVHTGYFLQPSNSSSTTKASEPLFTLMRSDIMRVTVQVPELDAGLVKGGDAAVVRLQALPGKEVVGTVTRYSWSLDEKARTLRVEVHLQNPKGELRPGMYAKVNIITKVPNALTLPPAAILSDILANKDQSYCFIVENGKAKKTLVELGVRGEEGIQVLRKQVPGENWDDFSGTEAVVVSNPGALLDGQSVQVRPPSEH